jgi:demethylmenaquinone methyltransferase/2-methoxy-6-polyprenyl-1,4-benzoquinol methylase
LIGSKNEESVEGHEERTRSKREHASRVGKVFESVAPVYDPMNRLLSLGRDSSWRRQAAAEARLEPGDMALDVAVGTADMALALLGAQPKARVVGLDPSWEMIVVGRRKVEEMGKECQIELMMGDGLSIPFADGAFHAATVSFGARNVSDVPQLLLEMARVTRPGGRVVCLEIVRPSDGMFGLLARFYFDHLIPLLGRLLVGRYSDYAYLPESLDDYLTPEQMTTVMRAAGFRDVMCRRLMAGTITLHVGSA